MRDPGHGAKRALQEKKKKSTEMKHETNASEVERCRKVNGDKNGNYVVCSSYSCPH
jgi:hypothetical protein